MIRRKRNPSFGQDVQELYRQWLESKLDSEETLKRYLSYAEKLGLSSCDPKELRAAALASRSKSKWYKNAFRNWLNLCFELGEIGYDELHRLRRLAAGGRKSSSIPGAQHVELKPEDLERLSARVRPYCIILYYSGARGTEVLEAKRRLSELKCEGEICWLELNWARGNKRSYVLFAPKWAWEELKSAPPVSEAYLKKAGRKVGGLKALRKHWYQKCVEVCDSRICDFMQGRAKSVSVKHYLDAFEKAKKCYPMVKKALEGEVEPVLDVLTRVRELVRELERRGLL